MPVALKPIKLIVAAKGAPTSTITRDSNNPMYINWALLAWTNKIMGVNKGMGEKLPTNEISKRQDKLRDECDNIMIRSSNNNTEKARSKLM